MKKKFTKKELERYSRQIILKDVSFNGQKLISDSKVLIVGMGGLGCPIVDYLARAGIRKIGIVDHDKINTSNLHRQSMYYSNEIGKYKVDVIKKKIFKIDSKIKIFKFKEKIQKHNIDKIIRNFDIIVDGSDNFKTKFLLNKYSLKFKKILIVGAISKMDGHIFTFNFKNKNEPCLKCFYQSEPSDEILNCEFEGILGPVAGIVGSIQAIEILKKILNLSKKSNKKIFILDLNNFNFRKVEFKKKNGCLCKKY